MKKVIILTGPTGVGKTKLSIDIAKRYGFEIINADAFQVYKGMEILTASPKREEKEEVKHVFFNYLDPTLEFSIYDYQQTLRNYIDKSDAQVFFLVGGSGLYINSLIYDYNLLADKRDDAKYQDLTNEEILDRIKKYEEVDLTKVDVNNRKRLTRILDLLDSDNYIDKQTEKLYYDSLVLVLSMERDKLYERINNRVSEMVDEGLIKEVESLSKMNLSKTAAEAIGYKELLPYIKGEQSLNESLDLIRQNSRHLAKRQITWFKHKLNSIFIEKVANYEEIVFQQIDEFLKGENNG